MKPLDCRSDVVRLVGIFRAHYGLTGYLIRVPEDYALNLLVADPALVGLVSDELPLSAAWHLYLVPHDPRQNTSAALSCVICDVIHETENALSFHVLLDFYSLAGNRLLSNKLFTCSELPLENFPCIVVLELVQDISNREVDVRLLRHASNSFLYKVL